MLAVDGLAAGYGAVAVLDGLSLAVEPGRIVAVLGANGAGKTTLLRVISGLLRPTAGAVRFDGRAIHGLEPEAIVALGISHVPQGRRIFPGLTVYENLVVARTRATRQAGRPFERQLDDVYQLFPRLAERRTQLGWSLSGGEQQMLAVARALIARPRLILLDEPSLGLAPLVVAAMFDAIALIRRRDGLSMLLVEQNVPQALRIADYVHVLEHGRPVAAGTPEALARDPAIEAAFLGG